VGSTTLAKKLLHQARGIPRTKHYSYCTEQAYLDWIKRYLFFHNKSHPKEIGNPEIQAFLTQLASFDRMGGVTKLMPNGWF